MQKDFNTDNVNTKEKDTVSTAIDFFNFFSKKDFISMQNLYSSKHFTYFSDPVFQKLNLKEVQGMWKMLLEKPGNFTLDFSIISLKNNIVKVNWVANYTFSATGKKVRNVVVTELTIVNYKIVKHTDHFNLCKWSCQALGFFKGALICSPIGINTFRKKALNRLQAYLE